MKRSFFTALFLLIFYYAGGQDDTQISIGRKETIYSEVLKEKRTFWIYTPAYTSRAANPGKQYPVIYVLDGEAHFFSVVGIIQQLSQANGNGVLPEMMVVGIENTDRLRDLVPSGDNNQPNPFTRFLSAELMPYINEKYRPAPYCLLAGHSLGGLTVMDILAQSPRLFNAYIAIDPSMWYLSEKFLKRVIRQMPSQNLEGRRLFIGTANTLPAGMNLSQLRGDRSAETQHIRSIFKLDSFLRVNKNDLYYSHKYYEKEKHNTVPLLSMYDGLRFVFDYYEPDISERDFADTSAVLADKMKTHYTIVSNRMGYKNTAPESLVNYLAYEALQKKHFRKAKELFMLNSTWFPESHQVYSAFADYYVVVKDTANALATYQKAKQLGAGPLIESRIAALTGRGGEKAAAADLSRFTGVYNLELYNIPVVLEIRSGKLWAKVPGQPDDELLLLSENVFTVKGKQGYTITFQMNGNQPKEFISVQPNGTFKAVFQKK